MNITKIFAVAVAATALLSGCGSTSTTVPQSVPTTACQQDLAAQAQGVSLEARCATAAPNSASAAPSPVADCRAASIAIVQAQRDGNVTKVQQGLVGPGAAALAVSMTGQGKQLQAMAQTEHPEADAYSVTGDTCTFVSTSGTGTLKLIGGAWKLYIPTV